MNKAASAGGAEVLRRGGLSLAIRQVLGMALGLVSAVAITRTIGPHAFGAYAAAFGVMFIAQTIGELGLDVYLVRSQRVAVKDDEAHQVFWILAALAIAVTTFLSILSWPFAYLVHSPGSQLAFLVMFLSVPLVHLQQVPLSLLEREFRYSRVGLLELVSQGAYVVVGVVSALAGAGVWAPISAWYVQQLSLLVGVWVSAGYRPRWRWNWPEVWRLLRWGLVTTSSTAAYSTRNLVPPMVVGAFLGTSGVGYVSLAARLLEQAAFVRLVITRMAYAVMGKFEDDEDKLRKAVQTAMGIQVIAVGFPVVVVCAVAPIIVPWVFGSAWRPTVALLGLLAPGVVVTAMFTPHVAVLVGRETPWEVSAANSVNTGLLWLSSIALTPVLGIQGYGVADVVSVLSWSVVAWAYWRHHSWPAHTPALMWAVGLSAAAISFATTPWVLLIAAVLLLNPIALRYGSSVLRTSLDARALRS